MFSEILDYNDLTAKLKYLEFRYNGLTAIIRSDFGDWNEAVELSKEIHEAFKTIKYPTKQERDIAWQHFYTLRNKVYQARQEHFVDQSKVHFDTLIYMLHELEYHPHLDGVVSVLSFDLLSMTKERMKELGKELNEAAQHFSSIKNEMISEHKTKIHERIVEIRESHDIFWNDYKDRAEEFNEIREQKKKNWEERQERKRNAKERIESNLESNKEKLQKATNALERFEATQSNLEDKIASAYSDSFRERHEEWLEEINEKIESVKEQIERLESWIQEDERKLEDWED